MVVSPGGKWPWRRTRARRGRGAGGDAASAGFWVEWLVAVAVVGWWWWWTGLEWTASAE
jgi:hypothetical protein